MKIKKLFLFLLGSLFFIINLNTSYGQSLGWLSFSANTTAPTGSWGNKHVVAIWVENTANPSVFIKTLKKLGHEDDHLTSWYAKSGGNTVDAVTGATPTSYGSQTVTWDGRDISQQIVTDGTYRVFIEMGWGANKVSQHSVMSFQFTKGPNADHQTPVGNSNFSNVSVDWVPSAVSISQADKNEAPSVFPNPSTGIINLQIKSPLKEAEFVILNSIGSEVYKGKIEEGFTGNYAINLKSQANGLYFIRLKTSRQNYVFKAVIYK